MISFSCLIVITIIIEINAHNLRPRIISNTLFLLLFHVLHLIFQQVLLGMAHVVLDWIMLLFSQQLKFSYSQLLLKILIIIEIVTFKLLVLFIRTILKLSFS